LIADKLHDMFLHLKSLQKLPSYWHRVTDMYIIFVMSDFNFLLAFYHDVE